MLTNIISAIQNSLKMIGICVNKEDWDVPLDTLIQDSITYISFIVELETDLQMEIPDAFLQMDTIKNLNELAAMFLSLKQQETV